ncbi:MAG: hypothetical protein KF878_05450, partial [Planctomycetes bacterium]|nr:hypothetical protein [Planctomycetota bacterium]
MPLVRPALRGVLALRARVLRRRFGSPLEVVALLVACAVAWRAGAHVGARGAAWLDPLLGAVLLLGAAAARSLLYAARELALLLPAGLTPRELAAVRGAELAV